MVHSHGSLPLEVKIPKMTPHSQASEMPPYPYAGVPLEKEVRHLTHLSILALFSPLEKLKINLKQAPSPHLFSKLALVHFRQRWALTIAEE